jgi:hypothetical protein
MISSYLLMLIMLMSAEQDKPNRDKRYVTRDKKM